MITQRENQFRNSLLAGGASPAAAKRAAAAASSSSSGKKKKKNGDGSKTSVWTKVEAELKAEEAAEDSEEYVVEKLMTTRRGLTGREYQVKWYGYEDPADMTWVCAAY